MPLRPNPGSAVLAVVLLAGATFASPAGATLQGRNAVDAREIELLRKETPEAIPLIERGEAALFAGRNEEAAARFSEAAKLAPHRALPQRRKCQALTILGRTDEAKDACELAMAAVGTALDARAAIGAALSTPKTLTAAELTHLEELADRARRLSSHEPWGWAAECDIARRLGETAMLKECLTELANLAPHHYETEAARAALQAFSAPPSRLVGWAMLGVLSLVAAMRALGKRRAGRARGVIETVAVLAFLSSVSWSRMAVAQSDEDDSPSRPLGQLSTKFPIDLEDPKKGIPNDEQRNKDPVQFGYWLMDLSVLADNALKQERYADAAKFFDALVTAVPDRAVGHSKLCRAYLGMGEREKALGPCKLALAFEGSTVDDHIRYSRLLMSKQGALTPAEIADIDAQVAHLHSQKVDGPADRIACELATKLDDTNRLAACTAGLVKTAPEDLGTVSFQWALALAQGNFSAADAAIQHAEKLGMTDEGLARMRSGVEQRLPLWRLAFRSWRTSAGLLLLAFAFGVLWVTWRRTSGERPSASTGNA
ncbi:MAG TPA: hypothetical protein VHE30_17880 [Polyangiaceae bacterium]|nr:hypothetical protein [Polyangiaceae bacterium]